MRRRLLLLCSTIVALQLLLRLDWFASRDADVELVVNAVAAVVDEQFVCATLDLWPPEKCNAGTYYGLLRPGAGGRIVLPNPDFWVAWFWRRLMGRTALDVGATAPRLLRVYAHCGPRGGIALCVVNVDANPRRACTLAPTAASPKTARSTTSPPGPAGCARATYASTRAGADARSARHGAVPRARSGRRRRSSARRVVDDRVFHRERVRDGVLRVSDFNFLRHQRYVSVPPVRAPLPKRSFARGPPPRALSSPFRFQPSSVCRSAACPPDGAPTRWTSSRRLRKHARRHATKTSAMSAGVAQTGTWTWPSQSHLTKYG